MQDDNTIKAVFKAAVVHSLSLKHLEILPSAYLGVRKDGTVAFLARASSSFYKPCSDSNGEHANGCAAKEVELSELKEKYKFSDDVVVDLGKKIIMPGLIDTHMHAPQYLFTGTGTDLPLLEWLNKYTFPSESKCKDAEFARDVFTKAVKRSVKNGTTTCVYFSTIHLKATEVLADIVGKVGQRAFIGKVCMDRNSPDYYVEDTQTSVKETEEFINTVLSHKNALITPVITPRFAPSCTSELMTALGKLSDKYPHVPVQSHISENRNEVAWVSALHPDQKSYTDVYAAHGLLNNRTIMAHGVHLSDEELKLFKERDAAVSHCPVSNFTLCSGTLCARKLIDKGIKLGLGTDVSGGYSTSILETIRQALIAANVTHLGDSQYQPLSWQEAFYLATVGGSQVINMPDKLGNFLPGKYFDAVVVDPYAEDSPFDVFEQDQLIEVFQKFIFLGDSRSISKVYVNGNEVSL